MSNVYDLDPRHGCDAMLEICNVRETETGWEWIEIYEEATGEYDEASGEVEWESTEYSVASPKPMSESDAVAIALERWSTCNPKHISTRGECRIPVA